MIELLEEAHKKFDINEQSGELVRKVSAGNCLAGTSPTFISSKGYRKVHLLGKSRFVHRIVWLMVYGSLPDGQLDHLNQDKLDNRIGNLREVDTVTNCLNISKKKSNSTQLYQGISLLPSGKFRARLQDEHIGVFDTAEEASFAYKTRKQLCQ